MTIHPKLIEMVARVILETQDANASVRTAAVFVIEALRPLMERIANDCDLTEPASLTVARHLAADPEVKP